MPIATLIRLGGLAAMFAGILRSISAFVSSNESSPVAELLYLLTDIFLIFGMMGIYGFQQQESRRWGFFGFLIAIVGILIIRTRAIFAINLYPIGAIVFAVGLSLLAIDNLLARKFPQWIAASWIASIVIGFIGYFLPSLSPLFVLSGVIFGISFAGAGIRVYRLS